MLIDHLGILEPLSIMLNLRQHICWQGRFLNILHPLLRPTAQIKKFFQKLLLIDNNPRTLEMYSEIHVVFIPANTTSILQPMGQGVILDFPVLLFKK